MPGGSVYQPTTVSYEPQNQWASPAGFLAPNGAVGRARCIQYVALALGLIGIASGLVMIIEGSVDLSDTESHNEAVGHTTPVEEAQSENDVTVIIIGALLLCMGLAFVIFYLMIVFRRRGCPCFMSKEQRMARALRSPHSTNGHGMNPSTDLLVAAQYAPVSEIAYHPPAVAEEEETRKLMGSENKDCLSSDESERILENKDPRIVLRPLTKLDETESPRELILFEIFSLLKESDSVISLDESKFEFDLPARRLSNLPPILTETSNAPTETEAHSGNIETEPKVVRPVGRKSSWRQAIQRKASVRSRKAPLAAGEEITPSLASSFNSLYFNAEEDDESIDDDDSLRSEVV